MSAPAPRHDVSCSVMFSMPAVMRCGRSGHGAAGSGAASPTFPTSVRTCREGRPGFISGVFRLRFPRVREDMSGHGVSPFRSRSVPSARRRRDPYSRVMRACACALGRAFRAGAVCAPDCPGTPPRASRTHGARLPSAPQGLLHAGANRNGLRMPLLSSGPLYGCPAFQCQLHKLNYFKYSEQASISGRIRAALPGRRRRQGRGGRPAG